MNLNIKTEGTAEVRRLLASLGPLANEANTRWVNWIGIEAQGEMRKQLPSRFALRGTQEQFRKAIVFQAATLGGKREKQAVLKVGADGAAGTKASATKNFGRILARHEEADTRSHAASTISSMFRTNSRDNTLIDGGFFLPAKGMRTSTRNPPRSLYPTSIGAQIRTDPKGNLYFAKGTKKGTKKSGTGASYFVTEKGIFRRKHTSFGGRVEVEALWWFTRTIRTPARLQLWATAERVFNTRAIALGMQAIDETMFRATL